MGKPVAKRRRPKLEDRFSERGYRPYIVTIGQFVLAWNSLHEKLGLLFVVLLQAHRPLTAGDRLPEEDDHHLRRWAGVWSSAAYDRPKRAMLKALMNPIIAADFNQFPKLLDDVSWILSEADKIEEIRNNAVHAPLIWVGDHPALAELVSQLESDVIPNLILANKRALLVSRPGMRGGPIKEYRWGRDASLVLRDFTVRIGQAMTDDGFPWPDRPRLPNRGDSRAAKYRPRPKPPRPPRSSQE